MPASQVILDQVLAVNRRFYDAFEARDVDAMEACCNTTAHAQCLHPAGVWLRGWDEVRPGWEHLFANIGYIEFELSDIRVHVLDPIGIVTCVERVTIPGSGGATVTEIAATNLFVLGDDGWRLLIHHASPAYRQATLDEE